MKKTILLAIVAMFTISMFAQQGAYMRVWEGDKIVAQEWTGNIQRIEFLTGEAANVAASESDIEAFMYIEDLFNITGRGAVATGKVGGGTFYKNQPIKIINIVDTLPDIITVVAGLEMFKKEVETASKDDNIGMVFPGNILKTGMVRGGVVASIYNPTILVGKKISLAGHILTKEEGGRHTPFFTGYRPQIYVGTADVTGQLLSIASGGTIEGGVMPGDNVTGLVFEGVGAYRFVGYVGQEVTIRESGKTIGTFTIESIED